MKTEELQSLLGSVEFSFRFQCGYSKSTPRVTLDDKGELVRCVWLHYVHFQVHTDLNHNFSYPNGMWVMLAASDNFKVTPEFLCDSFSVQYSHNRSNNHIKEETIIFHWNEYIFNCPQTTGTVSLSDVMKFISGSSRVPATGFDKAPSVKFTDVQCLPTVSTCDISITFLGKWRC